LYSGFGVRVDDWPPAWEVYTFFRKSNVILVVVVVVQVAIFLKVNYAVVLFDKKKKKKKAPNKPAPTYVYRATKHGQTVRPFCFSPFFFQ